MLLRLPYRSKATENIAVMIVLGMAAILFVVYYPVISGMDIEREYVNNIKLLKSWVF
jgi:dolichyl-phosphate-mannose--protein O-mannosyl transferase